MRLRGGVNPATFGAELFRRLVRRAAGDVCGGNLCGSSTVCIRTFSFQQDGSRASKIDVSRDEIAQALVIAAMVVVVDECVDLEGAGQIIVLKQDAVLERLMPRSCPAFAGGRARRAI
jgi:hypothetical protein